jgi:lactoylglutathione lyase
MASWTPAPPHCRLQRTRFAGGHVHADQSKQPLGFEIAFVTDDVQGAHLKALQAGAKEMATPLLKPWGQTVSYVRCPDGILVELCTPIRS